MADYRGVSYLRNKLNIKRPRVLLRYEYYDMKNDVRDFSKVIPRGFEWMRETLGWCSKAVDSMADRLVFNEFKNDTFNLNEIFQQNNKDIFFDNAVLSALISSCCFIYISKDDNGYPRLQVIDGANATGVLDETTGLLTEGYAVLDRDDYQQPTLEAYFTSEATWFHEIGGEEYSIPNTAPYPLLVPIINRPDASRPFGHSRISRACMDIQQSALRTIKRSEISAEFYSFPQKYILGLSDSVEDTFDNYKATMSSFLSIGKDEDGDKATVGQFSQQSMSPYTEQLKTFASLFSGETGLTLDDLGFPSDNPSSAEAIKSAHENLRLEARKAQRTFGSGFLNVGYLSACLRDDYAFNRNSFYQTEPRWLPLFEPDTSMLSSIGDGAIKLNQAVDGYLNKDNLEDLTGISAGE
jgi:hypothetical protein